MKNYNRLILILLILCFTISTHLACTKKPEKQNLERSNFCGDEEREILVFDQSKAQIYTPFQNGFEGLSILGEELTQKGLLIKSNNLPLDFALKKLKPSLTSIFLGPSLYKTYNKNEIKALKEFTSKGGKLFIITEHDNFFKSTDFQNLLLSEFGISSDLGSALGKAKLNKNPQWPLLKDHSSSFSNLKFFLPVSLKSNIGAEILLEIKEPEDPLKKIVGLKVKFNKGSVYALGDMEFFWNMTDDLGIKYGDNLKYIKKLFLSPKGIKKTITPKLIEAGHGKRIHIEHKYPCNLSNPGLSGLSKLIRYLKKSGYKVSLGTSNEALFYQNASLVIVVDQQMTKNSAEKIMQAKKILVLGNGQSDILRKEPELKNALIQISGSSAKKQTYSLNQILSKFDLKMLKHSLLSKDLDNELKVKSVFLDKEKDFFNMFRACSIDISKRKEATKIVSFASENTIAKATMTPKMINSEPDPESQKRITEAPSYKGKYITAISTPKIFAICDHDFLTDQHFEENGSQKLLEKILTWLK